METQEHDIWIIVGKVLSGTTTKEEQDMFNAWIEAAPENQKFFEIMQQNSNNEKEFTKENKERIFLKLQSNIQRKAKNRKLVLWTISVAASVIGLVAFSYAGFKYFKPEKNEQVLLAELNTPFGVKSKINLPDGTLVYLNAGSTIKYPASFNKNREVSLSGEAYFEVAKDKDHPFIVSMNDMKVKVLGTHFNIKAYENEEDIETTLIEGSVEILKDKKSTDSSIVVLKPNQQAIFNKSKDKFNIKKVDVNMINLWKDGKLCFDNEEFRAIALTLERWYNIKIVINSKKIGEKKFLGIFQQNRTVYQLLDVMKVRNSFIYHTSKDTIYINEN